MDEKGARCSGYSNICNDLVDGIAGRSSKAMTFMSNFESSFLFLITCSNWRSAYVLALRVTHVLRDGATKVFP